VILSIVGVVALFGSGAGEAGVAAEGAEASEIAASSKSAQASQYLQSEQGQGLVSQGVSWLTIGFLLFALVLVGITGVLAAVAASNIKQSLTYKSNIPQLETAYTDCVIAASVCLGAGGLLIIGTIIYFIVGYEQEQKIQAQREAARKEELAKLYELKQLQEEAVQERLQERTFYRQQMQQQATQQSYSMPPPPTSSKLYNPTSVPPTISQQVGTSSTEAAKLVALQVIAQKYGLQVPQGVSANEAGKQLSLQIAAQKYGYQASS
jgi:hypothetical protein